jgi:tRNA (Thr-GGU) A37 N-methylase
MPIQAIAAKGAEGYVELAPEYPDRLRDAEGFYYLILLYHLHLARGFGTGEAIPGR